MSVVLIADSGSTKTEWCLIKDGKLSNTIFTQGISPYFLNKSQIENILNSELKNNLNSNPDTIYFYGTGCSNPVNVSLIKESILSSFHKSEVIVNHDLMAAARALCGNEPGIVAILGTGSNSCYYDGVEIIKNSPGLGFILGDEGSGAYLGKKVIQYYLYNTFEPELFDAFKNKYNISSADILNAVYKEPLPNRYLAKFVEFLYENRGHFIIENIIEDG
ncbi:MAG: N-acetylglucosamine kinase, partial [Ferruginibacter sp.]